MSIRFSAIGLAHSHIYGQVNLLRDAGAEFVNFFEDDAKLAATFSEKYPEILQVETMEAILEDESIDLVISAAIPNQRAPIGIRAMQHGKDYFADKPAFTSLEQLEEARKVQAETGRIYSVYFGERFSNRATVKASELVHAGAIGQVVQTVGFGPHRLLGHVQRDEWVFDKQYFGGVINDLASHQMDQFLHFTGSTEAEVVASHVGLFKHPQFTKMHDFGDVIVRSPSAVGYVRVDWMTPKGLNTWGDVRLFILGTEGYIELRKNADIGGRDGANHLFLVDNDKTEYVDCADVELPFGKQLVSDILNRTETAMPQAHAFLASELALKAELNAVELRAK